jgi:hypothetical protein
MSAHASSAMYRSVAATAATASPGKRTRSTVMACCGTGSAQNAGIGLTWASASSPVNTATTPGSARAALVSIDRIRAWACGLRSTAPCSIPGTVMSPT